MFEPLEITIGNKGEGAANIDHQYYATQHHNRYEVLKRIIDFNPGIYGIVFARTKVDTQEIAEKLTREGYDIDAIHGDLTQQQRDKVMGLFRDKSIQLLIATDVAARGIDVTGITHVINYELPNVPETYIHRIGRTGRAGASGISFSFCDAEETAELKDIHKLLGKPIPTDMNHPYHTTFTGISRRPAPVQSPRGNYNSRNGNNNQPKRRFSNERPRAFGSRAQ